MTSQTTSTFQGLVDEGILGNASSQALSFFDYGATFHNNLGISVDDVQATEVQLTNLLLDDTGSVSAFEDIIIEESNNLIASITDAKEATGVLLHVELLTKGSLVDYVLIENAPKISDANYRATGSSTPLYDKTLHVLGRTLAKHKEFRDALTPARSLTIIVTDGADNNSRKDARDVKVVVEDMLRQEDHMVFGVGIDGGYGVDFRTIFRSMGIPDNCILLTGNDPSELRRHFGMLSRISANVSKGGTNFSQAKQSGFSNMGGFGS